MPTRPTTSPTSGRPTVRPLDATATAAVNALVAAYNASDSFLVSAVRGPAAEAQRAVPRFAEYVERSQALYPALARYAVLGDDAGSLVAAREALEETTAALISERRDSGFSHHELAEQPAPPVTLRGSDLAIFSESLQETGLEELDVDLDLIALRDGRYGVSWRSVPRELAHALLLPTVYGKLEFLARRDPRLELERRASRWWFDRWSVLRRGALEEFSWSHREREWSLVDRSTMALGVSFVEAYREQAFFPDIGARQQALARALPASFAGMFVVRERDGSTTILESLSDGRRYEIIEHNVTLPYRAGYFAFGRIIPIESRRYLHSPGMAFVGQAPPALISALAELVANGAGDLAGCIRVEIALGTLLRRETLPRVIRPASSPAEAAALVADLRVMLDALGLAESASVGELPVEMRASVRDAEDVEYWRYDVDDTVAGWMSALAAQATAGGAPRSGGTSARQKRKRRRH